MARGHRVWLIVASSLLLLMGCSEETTSISPSISQVPIAKVGNEYIYSDELEFHLNRLLTDQVSTENAQKARDSVRDSLILSKQMAQKALMSMSTEEKSQIDIQVAQYKEELLAQRYIQTSLKAKTPTPRDITDYYQNNLHQFGGGTYVTKIHYTFENTCPINIKEKANYSSESQVADMLKKVECQFTSNKETIQLLNDNTPNQLTVGAFEIKYADNQLKAIYIESVTEHSAKPLIEVASDIRKRLAPVYFKEALKKQRKALNQELKVELFE